MATTYVTKSGKKFTAPSQFINPQTEIDARILRRIIQTKPSETAYIEGIVVSLKDWNPVRKGLKAGQKTLLLEALNIDDRIKAIDPSIHILFQGTSNDKEELMRVRLEGKRIGDFQLTQGGHRLRDVIGRLRTFERNKHLEKIDYHIKEVYPYMDTLIRPIMKFEIQEDSNIIIVPSVPITLSSKLYEPQIEKVTNMNKTGKVISDTLFSKEMKKRDLMFLLTVNPSVLVPQNYDRLIGTLIIEEENKETIVPDQIGIRIMNLDKNKGEEIQNLLDFIATLATRLKQLKRQIPIHIMNVREFGYVCFCYGATTITMPIARSPYVQISSPTGNRDVRGRYYHPDHMTDYTYEKSLAKARPFEYIIPCHCSRCLQAGKFMSVQDPRTWSEFRREHFILTKHMEIEEIKNAPSSTLNRHIQLKFSRSRETVWMAYLDRMPVLTFR